jgi:PTS system nitrogen regulatory IIA component
MRIREFLAPGDIVENLAGTTVPAILEELGQPVAATMGIGADILVAPLVAREKLGATDIGDGVALPHGKIPGLKNLRAVFGRSRQGIAFGSSDGPTHFFFALFVPEARPGIQLHALASVAGIMKSPSLREALLHAENSAEIYRILVSEDRTEVQP